MTYENPEQPPPRMPTRSAVPSITSLAGSAAEAEAVGLLEPVDLDGIYALDLLNEATERLPEELRSAKWLL